MRFPGSQTDGDLPGERAISWEAAGISLAESRPAPRWLDETRKACGTFEWVTLTYFAWLEAIVVLFHRNIPHSGLYFVVHLALTAGIAMGSIAAAAADQNGRSASGPQRAHNS